MSTSAGLNQEDFTKALVVALTDSRVTSVLTSTFVKLEKEIAMLRAEVKSKNGQIKVLDTKVCELEKKCDDLEQYSRRNSLRIQGLPEIQYEDVGEKILDLANDVLKVSPPLTPQDIDRVHRIGKPGTPGRPRPVILKMATYTLRNKIYRQRTKLRNCDEGVVFINEDLTATRSSLLWRARQLKRNKVIDECWSHDGQVLIKNRYGKVVQINSPQELPTAEVLNESQVDSDGEDEPTSLTATPAAAELIDPIPNLPTTDNTVQEEGWGETSPQN